MRGETTTQPQAPWAALLATLLMSQACLAGEPGSMVAGEVLTLAKQGCSDALGELCEAEGFTVSSVSTAGVLRLQTPLEEEQACINLLNNSGLVEYAERNGYGGGGGATNDTFANRQWHLDNTGQSGGTPGADLDAERAWSLETGSQAIQVAVLDSGVDSDHPDLTGRISSDSFDVIDNDTNLNSSQPHGTWVIGCLAANANNSFATAGLDHRCRVVAVRVLGEDNTGTSSDLAEGLDYATSLPNVRVISMSLINYVNGERTIEDALARARAAGKILIACAGNGGIGDADVSLPGRSLHTISIGATNRNDARGVFPGFGASATGARLDFVAPGTDLATIRHNSSSNTYDSVSGCSFATPLASATVTLLLAHADRTGQALDQEDVYDLLRSGAEDRVGPPLEDRPGKDRFFGHGRINAYRSLQELDVCPAESVFGLFAAGPRRKTLQLARDFRDYGLRRTPAGRRIVADYYRHAPQLKRILLTHPMIAIEAASTATSALRSVEIVNESESRLAITLPADDYLAVCRLASRVQEHADAPLREQIDSVVKLLRIREPWGPGRGPQQMAGRDR